MKTHFADMVFEYCSRDVVRGLPRMITNEGVSTLARKTASVTVNRRVKEHLTPLYESGCAWTHLFDKKIENDGQMPIGTCTH